MRRAKGGVIIPSLTFERALFAGKLKFWKPRTQIGTKVCPIGLLFSQRTQQNVGDFFVPKLSKVPFVGDQASMHNQKEKTPYHKVSCLCYLSP